MNMRMERSSAVELSSRAVVEDVEVDDMLGGLCMGGREEVPCGEV